MPSSSLQWRSRVLVVVATGLAAFSIGVAPAANAASHARSGPTAPPSRPTASLGGALRPDGTLSKRSGSFSAAGYRMQLQADGSPRFVSAAAAAPAASWSESFGASGTGNVQAVAVNGTHVYVGGQFTTVGTSGINYNHIAMWDGHGWHPLGTGVNATVTAIGVIGPHVFAGGDFTTAGGAAASHIAFWNGSTWSPLAGGLTNAQTAGNPFVHAIAVSGTTTAPKVYVGGQFDDADGQPANSVALWDGTAWSGLGNGIHSGTNQGRVSALALNSSTLYVGGAFDTAGTTHAYSLAKWDGSGWSLVSGAGVASGGFNGSVTALRASGTKLWVGGSFGTVGGTFTPSGFQTGGTAAKDIALLNGGTWSALGAGLPVAPLGITNWQSHVYAAGGFGGPNPVITMWNGSSWVAVGTGLDGSTSSATVTSSTAGVIAAGTFTTAGGGAVVLNHIGLWNGTAWKGYGLGMSAAVAALAANGSDLYAAGAFTAAGYTGARSIAHFDGSTWTPMGSGITGTSAACAASGLQFSICSITIDPATGDVYVGGAFTAIDGVAASNVAMWDGTSWHALSTGVNGVVNALLIMDGVLYAGGQFTTAGGQSADDLAQWNLGTGPWAAVAGNATITPGPEGDSTAHVTSLAPITAFTDKYLLVGGGFWNVGGAVAYGALLVDATNPGYLFLAPNHGQTNPGFGTNGVVLTTYVDGTKAYFGGAFTNAGGLSASDLAVYNLAGTVGSTWSIPAKVTTGTAVRAIAKAGSSLYIGGSFTSINSVNRTNIASYTPGAAQPWANLGGGLTGATPPKVSSLAQGSAGLYVGGDLSKAGAATPSSNLALWTGTAGQ
jgi:hypothetical protein